MGMPEQLTLFLKDKFVSNTLIETGTYYGATALWASKHFKTVHTIELSEPLYQITSAKYGNIENINFHFGDTRTLLKEILKNTPDDEKIILWLDAHWSSDITYGENDQCPLLQELEILTTCKQEVCILIDDARLFTAPPPRPNDYRQYPNIQEIASHFSNDSFICIDDDVIIVVPERLKEDCQKYLQEKATADWQKLSEQYKKAQPGTLTRLMLRIVNKLKRL